MAAPVDPLQGSIKILTTEFDDKELFITFQGLLVKWPQPPEGFRKHLTQQVVGSLIIPADANEAGDATVAINNPDCLIVGNSNYNSTDRRFTDPKMDVSSYGYIIAFNPDGTIDLYIQDMYEQLDVDPDTTTDIIALVHSNISESSTGITLSYLQTNEESDSTAAVT